MKHCVLIAAAFLTMAMAGCSLRGKPNTAVPAAPVPAAASAAAPSEPLSVPQTHVHLPPPQALDPQALVPPPPETPPAAVSPVPPSAPVTRRPPAASAPPKPEPTPAVVAEPARPSIQEVLPEGQRSKLQEDAAASRKRIRAWLDSTAARHLTGQSKLTRDRIQSFLKASEDAERRDDMREAEQLAERAEILIRELQGGR